MDWQIVISVAFASGIGHGGVERSTIDGLKYENHFMKVMTIVIEMRELRGHT